MITETLPTSFAYNLPIASSKEEKSESWSEYLGKCYTSASEYMPSAYAVSKVVVPVLAGAAIAYVATSGIIPDTIMIFQAFFDQHVRDHFAHNGRLPEYEANEARMNGNWFRAGAENYAFNGQGADPYENNLLTSGYALAKSIWGNLNKLTPNANEGPQPNADSTGSQGAKPAWKFTSPPGDNAGDQEGFTNTGSQQHANAGAGFTGGFSTAGGDYHPGYAPNNDWSKGGSWQDNAELNGFWIDLFWKAFCTATCYTSEVRDILNIDYFKCMQQCMREHGMDWGKGGK